MCDKEQATDTSVKQPTPCPPPALPGLLTGPLRWTAADFRGPETYIRRLDPRDLDDIDATLRGFKAAHGLDLEAVSRDSFPLPRLAQRLARVAETLHAGPGFALVRGLDASRYSVEESTVVYLGLASHVADQRGLQDKRGNVLSHITSSKLWDVPMEMRHGIHSSQALPFHTDMGCDILALQVRQSAETGGNTYLVSAAEVFCHILRTEAKVAMDLLAPNWPVQISGRKSRHYTAPLFALHDGRILVSLDPSRLGPHAASSHAHVPALNSDQRYALERVAQVASLHELRLKLEAADVLFFNNWAMLHRRDAYQDAQDSSRHMVRLWLRNTKLGWSIPARMLPPWEAAYGESSLSKPRTYPLHPMTTYIVPKYTTGSAAFVVEDSDESDTEATTS